MADERTGGVWRHRAWLALAPFAIALALHLAPRIAPRAAMHEAGVPFTGSDAYYHAHRASYLADGFPALGYFDPQFFHPEGSMAEWPLGFDYLAAAPLAVLGVEGARRTHWLSWTPIFLSLLAFGLFAWLATEELGRFLGGLATAAFATCVAYVLVSDYGAFDHHVNETTFVVALLLWPRILSRPRPVLHAALAAGLAVYIWTSTLLAFLEIAFLGLWLLCRVAEKDPRRTGSDWNRFVAIHLCVLSGLALLESVARGVYVSALTLSLLQPIAIGALFALHAVVGRFRRRTLLLTAAVAIAAVPILRPGIVVFVLDYVRGAGSMNISQTLPLFMDGDGPTLTLIRHYFSLLYVAFPVLLLFIRRREAKTFDGDPGRWFVVFLFVLSLAQARFAHFAAPGWALFVFLAIRHLTGKTQLLTAALALGILVEPAVSLHSQSAEGPGSASRFSVAVATYLRDLPAPGAAVSAPPNLGNQILYLAKRPVVTTPFFLPRYLAKDLALRSLESTEDVVAYLRKERIRYLVAVDDARYLEMLETMFDRERPSREPGPPASCSGRFLRFAYYRLACAPTSHPGLTLRKAFQKSTSMDALYRVAAIYEVTD